MTTIKIKNREDTRIMDEPEESSSHQDQNNGLDKDKNEISERKKTLAVKYGDELAFWATTRIRQKVSD